MANVIDQTANDILSLKIQSARSVAQAVLDAIGEKISSSKEKDRNRLFSDILSDADRFAGLRGTEPMLENFLRHFVKKVEKGKSVAEIKKIWKTEAVGFKKMLAGNFEKIVEYGSNLIQDGHTVMTHCRSSTVEGLLLRAAEYKKIKVICTETRPMYQGRTTAKHLAEAGIDVTLIVDSAVGYFMKEVDLAIVGADVFTARGALINKVGTHNVALTANEHQVPFYSATELWKYDPLTKLGVPRKVEMRDPEELLRDLKQPSELKGVKLLNPSFDVTDDKYINGFITEAGVLSPQEVGRAAEKSVR